MTKTTKTTKKAPMVVNKADDLKVTKVKKVNNSEKVNKDYTELYDILVNTIANKNALTTALNSKGYLANMHSKNPLDFTTINNDLYFQLSDGSRIFFGTNRKKVQLYITTALYENIANIKVLKNVVFTPCNDSLRKYNSPKNIEFSEEWLNAFMSDYSKLYAVKFSDVK